MKELIFIMLLLCFVALLQVNDTIVEVNLTPEERTQLAEKKEAEIKAKELATEITIKKNEENTTRLLSLSWSEVEGDEKAIWLSTHVLNLNSNFFGPVTILILIVGIFIFMLSAVNKASNGY